MAAERDFKDLYQRIQVLNEFPPDQYIPLVPVTLMEANDLTRLAVNLVKLSPDPVEKDVYVREYWDPQTKKKPKELAPTRKGLGRLMAAANIQLGPSENLLPAVCERCVTAKSRVGQSPDCAKCPNSEDVNRSVSIFVPRPDGSYVKYIFSKEIRLEEEKAKMKDHPNQFEELRR